MWRLLDHGIFCCTWGKKLLPLLYKVQQYNSQLSLRSLACTHSGGKLANRYETKTQKSCFVRDAHCPASWNVQWMKETWYSQSQGLNYWKDSLYWKADEAKTLKCCNTLFWNPPWCAHLIATAISTFMALKTYIVPAINCAMQRVTCSWLISVALLKQVSDPIGQETGLGISQETNTGCIKS